MFALINDSNDISTQQQAPLSCGNPLGGLENRDCESLIAHSCQLIGQPEDPSPSSSPCRSFLGFGEGGQGAESMTIVVFWFLGVIFVQAAL